MMQQPMLQPMMQQPMLQPTIQPLIVPTMGGGVLGKLKLHLHEANL